MANHPVKKEKCHICGNKLTIPELVDDAPFGMMCYPCEDKMYFMTITLEDEDWELVEH